MKSPAPSRWSRTLAFTAPAVALSITQANAAFDSFVKIGELKGEVQDPLHPNWTDILSFSFGIEAPATVDPDGTYNPTPAKATPFTIVKRVDKTSPELFLNIAAGQTIPTLDLELVKTGTTGAPAFYKLKLENVIITRMNNGGSSGEEVPTETIQFQFTKMTMTYVPIGATGKPGTPIVRTWDFLTQK